MLLRSCAGTLLLASACVLVTPALGDAQQSKGTEGARTELARGKTAMDTKDYRAAQIAFARAVELDAAWPEAHSSYQLATRYVAGARISEDGTVSPDVAAKSTETLRAQYETWIKAHPKTAGYLWALGDVLVSTDRATARDLCTKAVSLDPAFAPAYATLARVAATSSDRKTQIEFLRKASEADPDNPSYLHSYISVLWPVDPGTARALSLRMADRFPSDPATSDVLFDLAVQADDMGEKMAQLERLRRQPGTEQQAAMDYLYGVYVASDPQKALALAKEMSAKSASGPFAKKWSEAIDNANAILRVRSLIADKQFTAALAIAAPATKSPTARMRASVGMSDPATDEMTLLAAEAESGLGQGDRTYARVMDLFLHQPSDRVRAILARYASLLGKTPAAVDDDVRAQLVAKATPAPDFPILTYTGGRKGSLSDLRGKVVLLNFWFPT